jgi:hypothetical protein
MKEISFSIDEISATQFFKPIRCKADSILLLMNSIKHMLIGNRVTQNDARGRMLLRISKMSRLLYFTQQKQFSICFPFRIESDRNSIISIYSSDGFVIDNKFSSEIIELSTGLRVLETRNAIDMAAAFEEIENPSEGLWPVFLHLVSSEDGYLRYEHDPERADLTFHPLYHLDIFYDNSNTFKLGFRRKPNDYDLIDIIDISSQCYYIS